MPRFGSADPGVLQLGAHSLESGNQNHGCSVWAALNKEAKQDRGVNGRSVTSRCEHNQSSTALPRIETQHGTPVLVERQDSESLFRLRATSCIQGR